MASQLFFFSLFLFTSKGFSEVLLICNAFFSHYGCIQKLITKFMNFLKTSAVSVSICFLMVIYRL